MKKYESLLGAKTIIKDQSLMRHEEIRKQIRILPELEALIPPMNPAEFSQLEENIRKEGCREALLVWETTESALGDPAGTAPTYVLIDGHNRFAICQRHGLDFKIHLTSFASLADARFYMIDNQLGRRNLTPEQASYLRGLRYLNEKQEKGKYDRQDHKGQNVLYDNSASVHHKGQNDPYEFLTDTNDKGQNVPYAESEGGSTSGKLAQRFNVSEKTIKRDAEFAKGLSLLAPQLRTSILSGREKVNKGAIQQLSRLDQPQRPLETLQELSSLVKPESQPPRSAPVPAKTEPDLNEIAVLKKNLGELTRKLNRETDNLTAICDEVIRCTRQLKALLKRVPS
ncbi:hypothetical protein ACFQ4C_20560 [Larkinella insperata]|uniref:ParB/Sulfiredoxin domain-containing protein n=1 Tax=Larkinella insperata TaxID=332158 RepID=A0ABW3QCP4_9BACT